MTGVRFSNFENIFQFENSAASMGNAAELRVTRRFARELVSRRRIGSPS